MTDADMPEKLWPAVGDALRDWIEVTLEYSDDIPEPTTPESFYSHVLRMH